MKTEGANEDMRKLFFIGDNFYLESGSSMSSIYEEKTWRRYDWGFVQMDLRNGTAITIRPATEEELNIANRMLTEVRSRRELSVQAEREV